MGNGIFFLQMERKPGRNTSRRRVVSDSVDDAKLVGELRAVVRFAGAGDSL